MFDIMKKNNLLYKIAKRLEKPQSAFDRFLNDIFCMLIVQYGEMRYHKYKKKLKEKKILFNCSNDAGDLLYYSKYKHIFMKVHNINEKDTVFLCLQSNTKVAKTVGIYNPLGISRLDVFSISMAYGFKGKEKIDIYNVYPWVIFDDINFKKQIAPQHPQYKFDKKNIENIFLDLDLKEGRTVILAPYEQAITSYGLKKLTLEFWEKLASELKRKGYSVCTNCKGDEMEPSIKGTKAIFPRFCECEAMVSLAGYLIAIRSGFVDFSCNAQARIISLYPTEGFKIVFGITGLQDNYKEIIYSKYNEDTLIDYIIRELQ